MTKSDEDKVDKNALKFLKQLRDSEIEQEKNPSETARESASKDYVALVEKHGIGFGDLNSGYASMFVLYTEGGDPSFQMAPFIYPTKEEAEANKHAGATEMIKYCKVTYPDIYGLRKPTIEKIYKH